MRKVLFASILALIAITVVYAAFQHSQWTVPEEAKKVKSPLAPSDTAVQQGRDLYLDNCAQCHGETGKGDGPEASMYDPSPAKLTDAKRMDSLSDGELFYKISEGREPMPAFKKRLTEQERWQVILFVRTLAKTAASGGKAPSQ